MAPPRRIGRDCSTRSGGCSMASPRPWRVVIESDPGCGVDAAANAPQPRDFDEMRGADLWFVEHIAQSLSAHRKLTSLVISKGHSQRLEGALREMGAGFATSTPANQTAF